MLGTSLTSTSPDLSLKKIRDNEIEGLAIQRLPIILLWCENEWSSIARWIAT